MAYIAALCLMLFIFSLASVIVLNSGWLYELDIKWLGIDKTSGMSVETIRENYRALIRYNMVWNRMPLIFPSLPVSESGRIHFAEVKRIFDAVQLLCAASGIISIFLFSLMKGRQRKRAFRLCGILTLAVPAVLGVLAYLDWDRFFVTFHTLVFNNDYWLFDPATDPVILILPDTYFLHCAAGIFILAAAGSLLCLVLSGRKR